MRLEKWNVCVIVMFYCAYVGLNTPLEVGAHEADHSSTNCDSWPPPCSHMCKMKDGGHELECSCHDGYTLAGDHSHCLPDKWLNGPYLMYSQERHIVVKELFGEHFYEVPRKQGTDIRIGTFDTEVATQYVYYTSTRPGSPSSNLDAAIIKVTDFEGENDTEIITRGLIRITSIAVDWIGRVLYVSDRSLHQIIACSLRTHHCSTVQAVGDPASVAVNPMARKLYWSDCSSPHGQLYVSNMDGTETKLLVQLDDEGCIEELQIDIPQDTLYWINRGMALNQINYMRLKTKIVTEIRCESNVLALYADDIFGTSTSYHDQYATMVTDIWAEDKFDIEVPMDKKTEEMLPIKYHQVFVSLPSHISIVHKVQQPIGQNPCESSTCSHICLLSSDDRTTCTCPAGWTLSGDDVTCSANWTTPSVVVVKEKRIVRVVPDLIGSNDLDVMFEANQEVTALAFDWSLKTLYYSTTENKETGNSAQIFSVLLNRVNAKQKVVFNEESLILDMETDWTSGNLYWINSATRDIKVGRLDGSAKISLMQNINRTGIVENPMALALHPSDRKLYYSDCGSHRHIGVCDLAGIDCVTNLIDIDGGCASDLFLETSTGWLYWADTKNHRLMKSDPSQRSTVVLREPITDPSSIVSGGDRMFWTGKYESGIRYAAEHVNKDTLPIHFGVNGFNKMVYFADFVQQPQEKNECGNGKGRCNQGVCIPTQSGHQCHESDKATINIVETSASTNRDATSTTATHFQLSTNEDRSLSDTKAGVPSPATIPKSLKAKDDVNTKKQCNCSNGGECDIEAGGICRCKNDYHGVGCELSKKSSQPFPPDHQSDKLTAGDTQTIMYAAVGIISVTVIMAVIIAVVCIRKRRAGRVRPDDDEAKTLGTPLYENPSGGKNNHTLSITRPKLAQEQENDYC